MTLDPRIYMLAMDINHDLAWSALPNAPVVEAAPQRHRARLHLAAGLHRIASFVEGAAATSRTPITS
ncbi:MAG: hypothetical protein ABI912_05270 [Actinomycetota bacterium]